jgi:glycosyltransferase involved in cell wall biosynthesis
MNKIAIITRTKNRSIFLKRALESISQQTFKDFIWVVVNDGGAKEPVVQILATAAQRGITTKTVHLDESIGMEAASNIGIKSVESFYIVILDDDDSWEPEFLSETMSFLENQNLIKYHGVVSQTNKIIETISNDTITILKKELYNPGLKTVYLAEMARGNFFSNHSFVFRRDIITTVGLFDESLPVRGDWDFNLRFLEHYDIGVIPKPLVNWHHRTNGVGTHSNSVVGQNNRHNEYDAIIRNKYLRRDLKEGKIGLGLLLNFPQNRKMFLVKGRKQKLYDFIKKLFSRN